MKFYYSITHYNKHHRSELFPLLKPFIKGEHFTDTQRIAMYGISETDFKLAETIDDAEVCILPMSWNYYMSTQQLALAESYIAQAKTKRKIVWSFISGDHGVKLPKFNGVIVFRLGGYASRKQKGHLGMPVFIKDYLAENNLMYNDLLKPYTIKPIVGFCGQANASKLQAAIDLMRKGWFNVKSVLGLSVYEPEALMATSYLRARLLRRLQQAKTINDQFILRKQYRAGVTKQKDTHATTLAFYNNLLESQYVLCVRGGGNFSVRFYETLMMGRIPVYIHTDDFLPLSDVVDWKQHVVWIEPEEQGQIVQKVLSFHNKLTAQSFLELCKSNRKLWEEKLTMLGFYKTLSKGVI